MRRHSLDQRDLEDAAPEAVLRVPHGAVVDESTTGEQLSESFDHGAI